MCQMHKQRVSASSPILHAHHREGTHLPLQFFIVSLREVLVGVELLSLGLTPICLARAHAKAIPHSLKNHGGQVVIFSDSQWFSGLQ